MQNKKIYKSPYSLLTRVKPESVRWIHGFWAQRFKLCDNVMLSSMHKALRDPKNAAVISNFAVAAGLDTGEHKGTDWSDGDVYKWLEAVAHVYGVTRNSKLDQLMDEVIGMIDKAQENDGYISTQIQLTEKERWQDLIHHELYNMGHLMTAACVHHRVTGKKSFLSIATKVGDYLIKVFSPRPKELAHFGFNPSNIMGAIDLYRTTRESKYLELAKVFVDMRGSAPDGFDKNQSRIPLRQETEAVGHAVTAMYLYCGATDVHAETGNEELYDALIRIWENMAKRKMYITGAVGSLHRGFSLAGQQSFLTSGHEVWEAFGLDYQLPNRTAYNETCANIGNAMWNFRMLNVTGEAKYADVMETVLYNSMLSGMDLGGTHFCYSNPLSRFNNMPLLSNDTKTRWYTHDCYCCPPQVARTIAQLHGWVYGLSDEGVWIHLYGGSRLETNLSDGSSLKLNQETNYPWEGEVKITIEEVSPGKKSVFLRIPGWARGAKIKINNSLVHIKAEPATYAKIRREWLSEDTIELSLPMQVKKIKTHPFVEETRNQIAFMRGPIVYCLESPDLPKSVNVSEIYMPRNNRMTVRHIEDFLGEVTVLEGKAERIINGDLEGKLYLNLEDEKRETINITLIPYYAWGNRGISEMTVWLPVS